MLKYMYRVIILIGIFVASIYFFSRDIKEVVFDIDNTTVMEEVTFPLITIKSGEDKINLLHGFSSNLNANMVREAVTPLERDQTFEVFISQENYEIKKLNYELREFTGNALIETDSISVFGESGNDKTAKIKLMSELIPGKEYAVKITLITSESKKLYYYHRIKMYENAYLFEKLAFIKEFHNALKSKETAQEMTTYLESKKDADNSSLAYINIYSSFDLVSWGNLNPKFITEIVPTIKEIYTDTASVELNYFIEANISGVIERYRVTEFYRVRYTPNRMYLLNYERRMEALFDVNLASVAKNELKLGISLENKVPFLASADNLKLAFVRNRELWFYNLEDNEMVQVFSFRQEQTDYLRDQYDQHNIRILNMDAEGNIDFLVYGYMNRGQYEGKVAVVLYQFIRAENRIEEQVYIPVEETYQTLKENLGEFAYVNSKEVFYFNIYNNIYSFNLITRELTELENYIHQNQIAVLKELNYVTWQEDSDPKQSKNIAIMNMETGEIQTISAPAGYNIRLMGMIDSNIIYGFVDKKDIVSMMDGRIIAPLGEIEIATVDKKILKSYEKPGYYVLELEVDDNVVALYRVQKVENNGKFTYAPASDDYIMNQVKPQSELIEVTSRVTDQALTELYLTMPKGFSMTEVPKVIKTVQTVISQDPTVRLQGKQQMSEYYYPFVFGGIEGAYEHAADAIQVARDSIGVVIDNNHRLVWERGGKSTKHVISKFDEMSWTVTTESTMESCLSLMLSFQGMRVNSAQINVTKQSAFDILKEFSEYAPVRLAGITLEDALYYVSMGRPVIALTDSENAVLIYGYDAFNIMMIDPKTSKGVKRGIQDSKSMFEEAGNIFLSYLR